MLLNLLCEDRFAGLIHLLKKSKAPLPEDWAPRTAKTIGALPLDKLEEIVQDVRETIDPDFRKYEEYWIQQIANGNFPLDKIDEDGDRMNNTLSLFQRLSRKAIWTGAKDIFRYENWRTLEAVTLKLARESNVSTEPDDAQHSKILFQKTYTFGNDIMQAVYGEPAASATKTYYLRLVLTPEGACKYGKGTQWCTASKLKPREVDFEFIRSANNRQRRAYGQSPNSGEPQLFEYESSRQEELRYWLNACGIHTGGQQEGPINLEAAVKNIPAEEDVAAKILKSLQNFLAGKSDVIMNPAYYMGYAPNYIRKGLFIIELEDMKGRRPILQVSSDQIMNVQDIPITKFGETLKDFVKEAMRAIPMLKQVSGMADLA